jgi:hypothetical protein
VTGKQKLGIVLLTAGAAYLVWRLQEAGAGAITFVNPLTALFPGEPSPAGTSGAGSTNPLIMASAPVAQSFKAPGNSPAREAESSREGTRVNPLEPPMVMTGTAQPEQNPFWAGLEHVPNMGDPNFSAWNYLASTPPDLAWGVNGPWEAIYA